MHPIQQTQNKTTIQQPQHSKHTTTNTIQKKTQFKKKTIQKQHNTKPTQYK